MVLKQTGHSVKSCCIAIFDVLALVLGVPAAREVDRGELVASSRAFFGGIGVEVDGEGR